MIYSHSRLCTFEQCPYKFKLRYLDKIDPIIKDTIESFRGRMVHLALEKLYKDKMDGKENSLKDILSFFDEIWQKNYNEDEIEIVKKRYPLKKYKSMARTFITNYYTRYEPFNQTQTIGVEHHLLFNLDNNGDYKIQGFIDRLSEKKPGRYQIHDYKTGSRLPSQNQLNKDRQLGLYTIGVKQHFPDVDQITLVWHFLHHNKELQSKRSDEQLKKLSSEVIRIIDTIEQSTSFPCKPSFFCNWCEYKPICPSYSPLYKIKERNQNDYPKRRGQQRVDQYMD